MAFVNRTHCPICGRPGEQLVSTTLNHPRLQAFLAERCITVPDEILRTERYQVRYCAHDHFFYQSTIPSEADSAALYDDWIDADNSFKLVEERKEASPFLYWPVINLLLKILEGKPRQSINVLEFGAGWGDLAEPLAALQLTVTASELSTRRCHHMRQQGLAVDDRPLDEMQATHQEHYSLIIANQVIEHVSDPVSIVKGLGKLLTEDGSMLLTMPNLDSLVDPQGKPTLPSTDPAHWDSGTVKGLSPLNHINGFTRRALHHLVAAAGLTIVPMSADVLGLGVVARRPR